MRLTLFGQTPTPQPQKQAEISRFAQQPTVHFTGYVYDRYAQDDRELRRDPGLMRALFSETLPNAQISDIEVTSQNTATLKINGEPRNFRRSPASGRTSQPYGRYDWALSTPGGFTREFPHQGGERDEHNGYPYLQPETIIKGIASKDGKPYAEYGRYESVPLEGHTSADRIFDDGDAAEAAVRFFQELEAQIFTPKRLSPFQLRP